MYPWELPALIRLWFVGSWNRNGKCESRYRIVLIREIETFSFFSSFSFLIIIHQIFLIISRRYNSTSLQFIVFDNFNLNHRLYSREVSRVTLFNLKCLRYFFYNESANCIYNVTPPVFILALNIIFNSRHLLSFLFFFLFP